MKGGEKLIMALIGIHERLKQSGIVTNVGYWPEERRKAFVETAKSFGLRVTEFEEEHKDVLTGEVRAFPKVKIQGSTDADPMNPLGLFWARWEKEADPCPGYVDPGLRTKLGEIEVRFREEHGL